METPDENREELAKEFPASTRVSRPKNNVAQGKRGRGIFLRFSSSSVRPESQSKDSERVIQRHDSLRALPLNENYMSLERPIIPTFSLAERDRRWKLLRQVMREADLHALISLPNEGHWDQFGADTRYITQIGGTQTEVGAVLPLEDESPLSCAAPTK